MKATYYVINAQGQRVTRARWSGDRYAGKQVLDPIAGHGREHEQVLGIIEARTDLGDVLFRSAGPRFTVPGWAGLEGNYGALRIAVEALGMRLGALVVETDV